MILDTIKRALFGDRTDDRTERRQGFTDTLVGAFESTATEGPQRAQASAALESAAGLYSRALSSARVVAPPRVQAAVTPAVLEYLGRRLIRTGDALMQIIVEGGRIELRAPGSWYVRGPWDEREWRYWLTLYGPTTTATALLPGASVVHVRYAYAPERPWLGLGPLQWARSTGAVLGNMELRLSQEAGAPVGSVIPVPQDGGDGGDDDPLRSLKQDIGNARGRTLLVETVAAGWGEGRASAPQADWKPRRFGADPPATAVTLRSDAALSVLGACGVPPDLVVGGDGAGQRESWRRFLHGAVRPVARLIEHELARKLEAPVMLDFSDLHASDIQARARALGSMVQAGVPLDEARRLSGLA